MRPYYNLLLKYNIEQNKKIYEIVANFKEVVAGKNWRGGINKIYMKSQSEGKLIQNVLYMV